MSRTLSVDVAIMGGGMAGGLAARHLKREMPDLRVALFEKSHTRGYRAGESTVEIASHYLIKRLGLSSYLYEQHFPKNGLRFYFDGPEHDTELHEMSEIGSESLPFHPAFQIDRDRFDRDLLEMAEVAGVDVRIGSRIRSVALGDRKRGEKHRLEIERSGQTARVEADWLIDASGRTRILSKQLGLGTSEASHEIAAVWGRFSGLRDIDDLGPDGFRERVRFTSRRLSTLHFMYRGYWVWFIPLRGGITSVGVVGEREGLQNCRDAESLLRFLCGHRAMASLLSDAKCIDFQRYLHLAYGTKQFLSSDGWGMSGESAAFADPLYSPGSDFIALENDFLVDLVRRGRAGEDIDERTGLYDRFLRNRHDAVMSLYRDLYPTLGSYRLTQLKWDLDVACYYNLWLSPYMRDQHLDLAFLERQIRHQPYIQAALLRFADLFRELDSKLSAEDRYFDDNRGVYSDGRRALGFMTDVGLRRSQKQMLVQANATFNSVRGGALDLLSGSVDENRPQKPLSYFMSADSLA